MILAVWLCFQVFVELLLSHSFDPDLEQVFQIRDKEFAHGFSHPWFEIEDELSNNVDVIWLEQLCLTKLVKQLNRIGTNGWFGIPGRNFHHPWSKAICEASERANVGGILEQQLQLPYHLGSSLCHCVRQNPSQVSQILTLEKHLPIGQDPGTDCGDTFDTNLRIDVTISVDEHNVKLVF